MITAGASGDNIPPGMRSAKVPGNDVVDGQVNSVLTAILAGIVIPAKDFTPGKTDRWAGAVDHFLKADDGRSREE